MAISQGRTTESNNSFKRYTGIGNFTVLGVNPDLTTLHSWGVMLQNEPVYTGKTTDRDGKEVDFIRIAFYVKSVAIPEFITDITFFVRRDAMYNKDKSKVKVIDVYGNDGWATSAEIKAHATLFTQSGKKSKIGTDYRTAYRGEIEVTNFIKNLLNIEDAFRYVNEAWELKDDAGKLTCRFDHVKDWFTGDVSELRDALTYQTGNEIKLLAGVRTDKDGRLRQDIFTGLTCRAFDNNAAQRFVKEVNRMSSNKTEYTFGELKEHIITPATPEEIEAAVEAAHDDDDDLPFED